MMDQALDIAGFVGNPDEFPILEKWIFLNHAAVAPLSRRAAMAIVKYAGQAAEDAYIDSGWYKAVEKARGAAAKLLNASSEEIAFVKNTSEGLALVAGGLQFKPGDRIVTTAVEYPANAYPWIDLQQRVGVEVVRVPEVEDSGNVRRVPLEHLLRAADHPKTRLLTISHVEFGSGQRHDLATLGQFCRERGILFCVDAIQSLGVIPVDVKEMKIDFLSADGHKWLLAPEGAGIFFCRRELIEQVHPVLIGWLNVKHAHDFDRIDFQLKSDAGRFECGSWNIPGQLGLGASLELLNGIGIPAIWERVRELTTHLCSGLEQRGYTVISPRAENESSGIVSFTKPGLDAQALAKQLHEAKIELAVRAGRLRCSPHFYNTAEQLERFLTALP